MASTRVTCVKDKRPIESLVKGDYVLVEPRLQGNRYQRIARSYRHYVLPVSLVQLTAVWNNGIKRVLIAEWGASISYVDGKWGPIGQVHSTEEIIGLQVPEYDGELPVNELATTIVYALEPYRSKGNDNVFLATYALAVEEAACFYANDLLVEGK